jgi:two-component SAPR family response regulator
VLKYLTKIDDASDQLPGLPVGETQGKIKELVDAMKAASGGEELTKWKEVTRNYREEIFKNLLFVQGNDTIKSQEKLDAARQTAKFLKVVEQKCRSKNELETFFSSKQPHASLILAVAPISYTDGITYDKVGQAWGITSF